MSLATNDGDEAGASDTKSRSLHALFVSLYNVTYVTIMKDHVMSESRLFA